MQSKIAHLILFPDMGIVTEKHGSDTMSVTYFMWLSFLLS